MSVAARGSSAVLVALTLWPSSASAGDRVVGGHRAPDGAWPDAAAVMYGSDQGCTGVLVAPDVVLTAGHCAGGIRSVKLGVTDYTDESAETIRVTKTHKYPNYWGTSDIAVLMLESESVYAPRPIALDCILEDYLYDGAPVAIVGYGATDIWGTEYGSVLMEAFTTVTDHDCSDSSGCWGVGYELGAGGGGVDACYGDSGGPLYLLTDEGDFVVGLTSRSYDDVDAPCEEGGIYTRPDAVVEWIESVSGRTLQRPTCDGWDANDAPVPSAEPIEVVAGQSGSTSVLPNDPDAADVHTFAVLAGPAQGSASIDAAGRLEYAAPAEYEGADEVVVVVTDAGGLTGQVRVAIDVTAADEPVDTDPPADTDEHPVEQDPDIDLRAKAGCGCAPLSSPTGFGGALTALLLGLARRRVRLDRTSSRS